MLEDNLSGITIGHQVRRTTVVAYADDVTVFLTSPADFNIIRNGIQLYEKATGARLKLKTSKALAIRGWTAPATALGIEFCTHVKIL